MKFTVCPSDSCAIDGEEIEITAVDSVEDFFAAVGSSLGLSVKEVQVCRRRSRRIVFRHTLRFELGCLFPFGNNDSDHEGDDRFGTRTLRNGCCPLRWMR